MLNEAFIVYSQDEVGTLVIDVGSNSIRVGFAGEDIPKVYSKDYRVCLIMFAVISEYLSLKLSG